MKIFFLQDNCENSDVDENNLAHSEANTGPLPVLSPTQSDETPAECELQVGQSKINRKNMLPPLNRPKSKRSKLTMMSSIVNDLKSVHKSVDKEDDEFDFYGASVAAQLRKLSEEQATIARYDIQAVLTRCKLSDIRSKNTSNNILMDTTIFFNDTQPTSTPVPPSSYSTDTSDSSTIMIDNYSLLCSQYGNESQNIIGVAFDTA